MKHCCTHMPHTIKYTTRNDRKYTFVVCDDCSNDSDFADDYFEKEALR